MKEWGEIIRFALCRLVFASASMARAGKLVVLLLAIWGVHASTAHAETISISGTGSGVGTMRVLAQAFMKLNPSEKILILPTMGSGGGVNALLAGVLDVAVTGRPPQKKELSRGIVGIEYGKTPFVIVVAEGSEHPGLTINQLADIYSGKMNKWSGGSPLRLILRPEDDSDTKILKNMSADMRRSVEFSQSREGLLIAATEQELADYIEKIPGAVGPTSLALVLSEKRRLTPIALNGVTPSPKTIADGAYPYFKRLYLLVRPKGQSALAKKFVSFVLSPQGSEILSRTGHWLPRSGAANISASR